MKYSVQNMSSDLMQVKNTVAWQLLSVSFCIFIILFTAKVRKLMKTQNVILMISHF